jgi:hypothetical protein
MKKRIKDWVKKWLERLHATRHSPHQVAMGFAVGTFLNIATPGISFIIAIVVAMIFRSLSKVSLIIALAFWNAFTLAPVYLLSYKMGSFFFGPFPHFSFHLLALRDLLSLSKGILVANVIVGAAVSLMSYLVVYGIVIWRRRNHPLNVEIND